ncbi:Gfo/Idh/MocA family protein [Candidatus Pelagibacter sp. Uisw_090]|uniref:Gfo/Idh/MocA family protein n=1 Tax=Candidatus Pelagibacter sp. Uisw_090 TaxID=3230993 RepID=UPI0039E86D85
MYSFYHKNQNIALIGCGYWGTIIARTLIKLKFKNITIYDLNQKNSIILKKKFNVLNIENNFNNIINNNNIKNTFIAIPPSQSFELIKKILISKKNVFVEKPGVVKTDHLKIINTFAKKNNSKLMFGYIYCYNDYIKKIKKILQSKILGKINYLSFQRQNLGPIRNDVDVDYDLTSHDLSIINKFFGKLPKILSYKKYAILKKGISDISNLHLKLDGMYIDINNSWLNPTKIRKISIIGSKKMLLFDEMNLVEPLKIYNQYANYPSIDQFKKKFFNSKALVYNGKSYSIKVNAKPALNNEIKDFFNSKKPETSFKLANKILLFLKRI